MRVYETLSTWTGTASATSLLSDTVVAAPAVAPPVTPPVVPPVSKPAVKSAPAISGKAKRGSTLTLKAATFTGTAPMTLSYQWKRCAARLTGGKPSGCKTIAGARKSTLKLTKSDAGHRVAALVTARNTVGAASVSTRATGVVSK